MKRRVEEAQRRRSSGGGGQRRRRAAEEEEGRAWGGPEATKAAKHTPFTATSTLLQSSNTMTAALPPSSAVKCFALRPAACSHTHTHTCVAHAHAQGEWRIACRQKAGWRRQPVRARARIPSLASLQPKPVRSPLGPTVKDKPFGSPREFVFLKPSFKTGGYPRLKNTPLKKLAGNFIEGFESKLVLRGRPSEPPWVEGGRGVRRGRRRASPSA